MVHNIRDKLMRPFLKLFITMILSLTSVAAFADQLTLERIHGDPSLSCPTVGHLKMSPDGTRVTFLRGRDDDR